jgi:hypothetical protein
MWMSRVVEVVQWAIVNDMAMPDIQRIWIERYAQARPFGHGNHIVGLPEWPAFDDVADLPSEQGL